MLENILGHRVRNIGSVITFCCCDVSSGYVKLPIVQVFMYKSQKLLKRYDFINRFFRYTNQSFQRILSSLRFGLIEEIQDTPLLAIFRKYLELMKRLDIDRLHNEDLAIFKSIQIP